MEAEFQLSMTIVLSKLELISGGNVADNSLNGRSNGGIDGGDDNEVTASKFKDKDEDENEDKAVALFRSVCLVVFR